MKLYIRALLLSSLFFAATLLPSLTFGGPGIHGAKNVNTANNILNEFTSVTADIASGSTLVSVASSLLNANGRFSANLSPGELVLVIQMQGATMNTSNASASSWGSITSYNNAGLYEFNEVLNVPNGNTIVFTNPFVNSYSAAGKTQVIRVPRYSSFIVTGGGSLITQSWNGSTGGVIAIESNGNININGTADVTGAGFRGGIVDSAANSNHTIYASTLKDDGGEKGEGIGGSISSYDFLGGRYGRGAPANGGGGGNAHNTGGGGGSNADNGIAYNGQGIPDTITDVNWKIAWDLEGGNFHTNISSGGGRGGYSYSMKSKSPLTTAPGNTTWNGDDRTNCGGWGGRPLSNAGNRVYMGGGGGAGDSNNNSGGGGGNGGGIIFLLAGGNITGGGTINANGSGGINSTANDAAGGGGGGGSVILYARAAPSSGLIVNARGGKGGDQARISNSSGEGEGPGGGGGGGYVSITAPTLISVSVTGGANGTTNSPTFVPFLPNGATMGSTGLSTTNPSDPYSGGGSLPVSMLSITSSQIKNMIELSWITSSEINNDHFILEKSIDGLGYEEIGTIPGRGNSTIEQSYDFTDINPSEGINYYRLIQFDFDGRKTTYGTVTVYFRKFSGDISVYPNPFYDKLYFSYNGASCDESFRIEIMNTLGERMNTEEIISVDKNHLIELRDAAFLERGFFFIRIVASSGESFVLPLIHN